MVTMTSSDIQTPTSIGLNQLTTSMGTISMLKRAEINSACISPGEP